MHPFLRSMLLAAALGALTPDVALCQLPDDDFDEWIDDAPPPPEKKTVKRPAAKRWTDSPITWGVGTVALAVAIPLGVMKTIGQMRYWTEQQGRKKKPWEGEPDEPPK